MTVEEIYLTQGTWTKRLVKLDTDCLECGLRMITEPHDYRVMPNGAYDNDGVSIGEYYYITRCEHCGKLSARLEKP